VKSAPREATPFERLNDAVKKILSVPKARVEAREAALRRERARARKKAKKPATVG
jgi:hypothetical protein